MADWTPEELASFEREHEIRIAGARRDGSIRTPRIIWHALIDGALYVRSVHGPEAGWYVGARRQMHGEVRWADASRAVDFVDDASRDDALDAAFRRRYGNGSPTQALNREPARGTTLRVDPR